MKLSSFSCGAPFGKCSAARRRPGCAVRSAALHLMRGRSGGDAFFAQAAQSDHLLDALTPVDLCQHIGYTPVAVGGKGEFAIADILKSTLRVGQGVTVYDSGDMTGLGGRATEEFAARGHVEKDILDINDGAHRQAGWQVADDSSAFDAHLRAGFSAAVTAAKRQAADCGDAVEGFTAKTECGDGVEVGGAVQLAGGVALEGQRQFSGGDAVPGRRLRAATAGHLA